MRSACLLLALVAFVALVAVPTAVKADCVACYGNFCGDRTNCCGSDGEPQSTATADTEPCDDLDALCKAHDLCTAEYADDDKTGGHCMCDEVFRDGVAAAKIDPNFVLKPDSCSINAMNPNAPNFPGGCLDVCGFNANVFTLETAVGFVITNEEACTCSSGTLAGTVVSNVATDCPVENQCIEYVKTQRKHREYMHLGWFWRRLIRRRTWWWSWLWQQQRPLPPPECNGSLVPAQPPATQCTITFINSCVRNVPNACKCNRRDFRCLMQKNIFWGVCRSHVQTLIKCVTTDPRVVAIRTLLASNDFDSEEVNTVHTQTVEEKIKMVYWLPVMAVLFVGLITSLTYSRVRSTQYKKRIDLLNQQAGSRATGLSIVNGEEFLNINPASQDSAAEEVSAQ